MDEATDIRTQALPYLKPPIKDGRPTANVPDADLPVTRKLNNELIVTYLIDKGNKFSYVQNRHLAAAGLTEAELYECSIENLKKFMAPKLEVLTLKHSYGVILDQNFEASLLLVDDLWDKNFAEFAPHGFIAAIPARHILSFCDSNSSSGIEELRGIIRRAHDGKDHEITPILFRREGKDWVRYAD